MMLLNSTREGMSVVFHFQAMSRRDTSKTLHTTVLEGDGIASIPNKRRLFDRIHWGFVFQISSRHPGTGETFRLGHNAPGTIWCLSAFNKAYLVWVDQI